VLLLAVLAWAAASLLAQLGFAAEPTSAPGPGPGTVQEKFIPAQPRMISGATLEFRGEATITGTEVKLKQVCRWAEADKSAFEPIADFIIARMGPGAPFRALTLQELKQTLQDGGVNLAVIRFAGTTRCTITRSDIAGDDRIGLEDWVNARLTDGSEKGTKPTTQPTASVGVATNTAILSSARAEPPKEYHTLRELLIADLAERLSLDLTTLQIRFNPADEKALVLSEPQFKFNIDGRRIRNLGDVTWGITIVAGSTTRNTSITALAKAWQDQLIVQKPIAYHSTLRNEDILDRRALVETLTGESALKREQVIGQWAGQELKAGTILTPRLIDAAPLVRSGQLVTVTLEQGKVQITTVARAMEGGAFGQTIRAKNEATGNIYEVTLTGPQTARMSPTSHNEGDEQTAAAARTKGSEK
jgi:flagella basal body P-ring formation protein FlgA